MTRVRVMLASGKVTEFSAVGIVRLPGSGDQSWTVTGSEGDAISFQLRHVATIELKAGDSTLAPFGPKVVE